jgi:hypothetical protein
VYSTWTPRASVRVLHTRPAALGGTGRLPARQHRQRPGHMRNGEIVHGTAGRSIEWWRGGRWAETGVRLLSCTPVLQQSR